MVQVNADLGREGTCREYPGSFHAYRHKRQDPELTPEECDVAGA